MNGGAYLETTFLKTTPLIARLPHSCHPIRGGYSHHAYINHDSLGSCHPRLSMRMTAWAGSEAIVIPTIHLPLPKPFCFPVAPRFPGLSRSVSVSLLCRINNIGCRPTVDSQGSMQNLLQWIQASRPILLQEIGRVSAVCLCNSLNGHSRVWFGHGIREICSYCRQQKLPLLG